MWLPLFVDPRVEGGLSGLEAAGAAEVASAADAAKIGPGDLIDMVGEAQGNPMIRVLDFVAASMALLDTDRGPEPDGPDGPDGSGTTVDAERLVAGLAAAAWEDLRDAPVADVVVMVGDDLPVIVTLDRELVGAGTEALLDSGRYRVVGKVSEVFGEDEGVSLLRRTLLSATGLGGGQDLLEELASTGAQLAMTDPVVTGPALAVVPVAIFA